MKRLVFVGFILFLFAFRGTTGRFDEQLVPTYEEDKGAGYLVAPSKIISKRHLKSGQWQTVNTISDSILLPPSEFIAIRANIDDETVTKIGYDYPLTDLAWRAIEKSPDWLKENLIIAFASMVGGFQDLYANLILSADNPIIDEVAFQVAHISISALTADYFNPDLIVENAELIYGIEPSLHYVELVDYGSYPDDPNYYTTTRYRVVEDDDTVWVELPKDIYYWYILHPKLSDEKVKDNDLDDDYRQRTYGYFWRNYLLNDPDFTYSYTAGGYPLLSDVITLPDILWGRHDTTYPGGREFNEGDWALDVVGNWVSQVIPNEPMGVRPVQPNQIAYSHRGYCGEVEDLLCAGSRSALIPNWCTTNSCEDHVWNEYYDEQWWNYQVNRCGGGTMVAIPGGGQDVDYGGGKDLSWVTGWRGDGWLENVTPRYSNVCTLTVTVCDQFSFPIDGAALLVASECWNPPTSLCIAGYAYTDRTGTATLLVGDNQNFYLRADTPIGSNPTASSSVRNVITNSDVATHYTARFAISGYMYMYGMDELSPPDTSDTGYALRINWYIPEEYIVSYNGMDSQDSYFRKKKEDGAVAFFICDSLNYELFNDVEPFEGYYFSSLTDSGAVELLLPHPGQWYVVFSNQNGVADIQKVKYSVELVRVGTGIVENNNLPKKIAVQAYPNPFNASCVITANGIDRGVVTLEIYNLAGRMLEKKIKSVSLTGDVSFTWQTDEPSGMYLYRFIDSKGTVVGKGNVILCR